MDHLWLAESEAGRCQSGTCAAKQMSNVIAAAHCAWTLSGDRDAGSFSKCLSSINWLSSISA